MGEPVPDHLITGNRKKRATSRHCLDSATELFALGDRLLIASPLDRGDVPGDLSDKLLELRSHALSELTKNMYMLCLRKFFRWAAEHGIDPKRLGPKDVVAYIASRGDVTAEAVKHDMTAIRRYGLAVLEKDLCADPSVRAAFRSKRVAERAKKREAIAPEFVRQTVRAIDTSTLAGCRDKAIILLKYHSALRPSLFQTLLWEKTDYKRDGLVLHYIYGGCEAFVVVAKGREVDVCPVEALRAWQARCGRTSGPVFSRVDCHDNVYQAALNPEAVKQIMRMRFIEAGIDGTLVTSASMKLGYVRALHKMGLRGTKLAIHAACRSLYREDLL